MIEYRAVDLGASTADAEKIELRFACGDLTLAFVDWQEAHRRLIFREVLGFRWQEFDEGELGAGAIRDDSTYEVLESAWLERQAEIQGEQRQGYAHYVLCFNAIGTLEVLARRREEPAAEQ